MSVGEATTPLGSRKSDQARAEAAVDLALDLADLPADRAITQLLESVEFSYSVISRGRGICIARLNERPPDTRALLRALDVFSIALDDLDAAR